MVFSILSLQCTVQELGIRTEDIQGCHFAKRTVCVCVRLSSGPTDRGWGGGWRGGFGGRSRHTCTMAFDDGCCQPWLEIRFSGSFWYCGRRSRRKSASPLTWNENNVKELPKKLKYNKTSHSSLSLSYLHLFGKMAPIHRGRKSTAVRQRSARTRRAWATNSSVCVFLRFSFFFS